MRPSEILSEAIRAAPSVRAVATSTGIPRTTLQSLLDGSVPSVNRAAEICDALGLEFYVGPPRGNVGLPESRSYDPDTDDAEYVMVPKLPVRLAAGSGAVTPEEEGKPVGLLAFRREWMQRYGLQLGQVSAVEITGDSMEPLLMGGDTVLVDHRRNEARQGKVFAVRNEFDLLVKRLERQSGGAWILTSENKAYEPISMTADLFIIGEIVWRGTWLGEKMASRKQLADLLKLVETLAARRVETGSAAAFDQAIAEIEAEMARDGVFDDDD